MNGNCLALLKLKHLSRKFHFKFRAKKGSIGNLDFIELNPGNNILRIKFGQNDNSI